MAPHSSTLAWKILGMEEPGRLQSMESLTVGHDWATSLSLFTFHFHALEKEMATHSSVLAWRIPGTGEPGGLPSMGSHRVRHDWSDLAGAEAMCKSVLDSLFPSFNVLSFFNFYCYRFFWLCCVAYGVFSPQTGIKHVPPAPQAWSLNQWTSREVPPILSSEIKEVNRIICVRSERRNPSSLWMYPTCSHGTRRTCWRENFSIYCSWKKEICCG